MPVKSQQIRRLIVSQLKGQPEQMRPCLKKSEGLGMWLSGRAPLGFNPWYPQKKKYTLKECFSHLT